MSQGGQVTLIGYTVSEPKLRFTAEGTPVANLRVGSTARKIDRETGEWCDGDSSYFTVSCWRTLASNVASCLRKGEPIVVKGKFRSSSYEDREGRLHSAVDIEAETIGHDLAKGVAHFQRTRYPSADQAALAAGEAIRAGLDVSGGAIPEPSGAALEAAGSGPEAAGAVPGVTGPGAAGNGSGGPGREGGGKPAPRQDGTGKPLAQGTAASGSDGSKRDREPTDAGRGDSGGGMFDERAVAELEHEIDAAAPEPVPF